MLVDAFGRVHDHLRVSITDRLERVGGRRRLRITAEGAIESCLFGRDAWNVRLLRAGLDLDRGRWERSMSQVGG